MEKLCFILEVRRKIHINSPIYKPISSLSSLASFTHILVKVDEYYVNTLLRLEVRDGRRYIFRRIPQLIRRTVCHSSKFLLTGAMREKPLSQSIIWIWKFCPPPFPSAKFVHRGLIGAKSCQSCLWWTSTISPEHVNGKITIRIQTFNKLMLSFCFVQSLNNVFRYNVRK